MDNEIFVLNVLDAKDDIDNILNYLERGIIIENSDYKYIYFVKLDNVDRIETVPNTKAELNFIPSRIAVKDINEAKEYIKNLI